MIEVFSDVFSFRRSHLGEVDSRLKIIAVLCFTIAILSSSKPLLPVIIAVVCFAALTLLRIPFSIVMMRHLPLIFTAILLVLLNCFTGKGLAVFTFTVGFLHLQVTAEGLRRGILLGARVLGSMELVLLLGFTTPAYKLFGALRWFRLPRDWVDTALLMYRYIFVLMSKAIEVALAQKVRLGYSSGLRRSLETFGSLIGIVVLRSYDQALRTHEAMLTRGYDGGMGGSQFGKISRMEIFLTLFLIAVVWSLYFFIEKGPG